MSLTKSKDVFAEVTPEEKKSNRFLVDQRLYAFRTKNPNIQLIEGQKYPGQDLFWKRCFDSIRMREAWTSDLALLDYVPRVDGDRLPLYNHQTKSGSKFTRMLIVRFVDEANSTDENLHQALFRLADILRSQTEAFFSNNPQYKRQDVDGRLSVPDDWNKTPEVGRKPLEHYIDSERMVVMMKSYWYREFFRTHREDEWAEHNAKDINSFFVIPRTSQGIRFGCTDRNSSAHDLTDDESNDDEKDNEDKEEDDKPTEDNLARDKNKPAITGMQDTDSPNKKDVDQSNDSPKNQKTNNHHAGIHHFFDEEAKEEKDDRSDGDAGSLEQDKRNYQYSTPPTGVSSAVPSFPILKDSDSEEDDLSSDICTTRSKQKKRRLNKLKPRNLFQE